MEIQNESLKNKNKTAAQLKCVISPHTGDLWKNISFVLIGWKSEAAQRSEKLNSAASLKCWSVLSDKSPSTIIFEPDFCSLSSWLLRRTRTPDSEGKARRTSFHPFNLLLLPRKAEGNPSSACTTAHLLWPEQKATRVLHMLNLKM